MEKTEWCKRVKGGLELIEPNGNLAKGYILKAEESLAVMRKTGESRDWSVSTAYYTMYFSLYAILMKIGVKCEIHACTIEFMKKFLSAYFTREESAFMADALQARIDAQYYIDRDVDSAMIEKMRATAPAFLVKCKDIVARMREADIAIIRNRMPA